MARATRRVIGAQAPVVVRGGSEQTGWTVVVEQPVSTAFGNIGTSILLLALLVVLVGTIALLWAFRQARQFCTPTRGPAPWPTSTRRRPAELPHPGARRRRDGRAGAHV